MRLELQSGLPDLSKIEFISTNVRTKFGEASTSTGNGTSERVSEPRCEGGEGVLLHIITSRAPGVWHGPNSAKMTNSHAGSTSLRHSPWSTTTLTNP